VKRRWGEELFNQKKRRKMNSNPHSCKRGYSFTSEEEKLSNARNKKVKCLLWIRFIAISGQSKGRLP